MCVQSYYSTPDRFALSVGSINSMRLIFSFFFLNAKDNWSYLSSKIEIFEKNIPKKLCYFYFIQMYYLL